jgi:hypothetical protein
MQQLSTAGVVTTVLLLASSSSLSANNLLPLPLHMYTNDCRIQMNSGV